MPGLNTTGAANTADYNLGRGKLYIASLSSGLPDTSGWRDLGNCPEFSINVETETLEHFSSRQGTKTVDKEVVISQKINIAFQLDEINFQNLANFFSGTSADEALTNPAIAGVSNISITTSVVLGRWYDLKSLDAQAGVRLYDIDATKLSLSADPGGTPTPLVENTDYTVDEKNGRVFFLSTASNVTAGEEVDFTITADAGAVNPDEVKALTQTTQSVALKFIGINPANNDAEVEYQFHQVSLKADGDFSLIGDEFTTMGFTAVAERNETADADSPTLTIRAHVNS